MKEQILIEKHYEAKTKGELNLLADLSVEFPPQDTDSIFYIPQSFSMIYDRIKQLIELMRKKNNPGFLQQTFFNIKLDEENQKIIILKSLHINEDKPFITIRLN